MTQEEALRMALKALERSVATCFDPYAHEQVMSRPEHFVNQTITAIKDALAQTQEPVAWICEGSSSDEKHSIDYWPGDVDDLPIGTQLYASPPPQRTWVGLTNKEFAEILCDDRWQGRPELMLLQAQSKLKEKNNG